MAQQFLMGWSNPNIIYVNKLIVMPWPLWPEVSWRIIGTVQCSKETLV